MNDNGKLSYSITFEHDLKPCQTVKGMGTEDADLTLRRALRHAE